MKETLKWKIIMAISMTVFGCIGIFRKFIPWPSGVLASVRGLVGAAFLLVVFLIMGKKISLKGDKKSLWMLIVSGAFIGFNWITLFEAYNYTTVATATLCYYMAPVFVVVVTPFVFNKKVGLKGWLCVLASFIGILLISGVLDAGFNLHTEGKGVALALFSAVLYAIVVILNKKIKGIESLTRTMIQIGIAGAVLLPYNFIRGDFIGLEFSPRILINVAIVCFVITGFTYALYFSSLPKLNSTTIALFSYLDPVVAVILSVVILGENIGILGIIGAVLIIGSMLVNELL